MLWTVYNAHSKLRAIHRKITVIITSSYMYQVYAQHCTCVVYFMLYLFVGLQPPGFGQQYNPYPQPTSLEIGTLFRSLHNYRYGPVSLATSFIK